MRRAHRRFITLCNLVGVAELCNKIGKQAFTRHDEQIATTFAVYCAISISHCLLYRKLQEAHRRSHMAAELLVQGSTLSIAPEDILRFTVRDIPASTSFHPDFTQFFFVPRSIGTGDTYIEASLSMFKELGFIERFRLRRRTLARFLLMVQKGYRDVPYHNWSHAFAVGHFCYLLVRTAAVRSALTELERLSLFVACLCHDIDHRGTTNAFQLQSKTPLAQLYSSEGSVLERHHFAQTVSILSMEECNIFDQLTRQQYQTVLDNIREIILATDIAAHLRKVDRIKKMVEDGYDRTSSEHHYLLICLLMTAADLSDQSKDFKNSKAIAVNGYDRTSSEHHYLLICLLMTAADLSDQSKDFKNSKAIAENIYKEFFSQGDLEKQMGNRPLEMMDRDRACVPKIQLEFMDTVALPVFDYVSRILPDVKGTYNAILLNRRCWQVLDQILKEEGLPRGGLDYLRNVDLEEKVMKRIADSDEQRIDTPFENPPLDYPSNFRSGAGPCRGGVARRNRSWKGVDFNLRRLSLEVMTLNPRSENVETAQGVPLTVTGVAQIKVLTDSGLLETACEQFLGKSTEHIAEVILQTLEGHLRAILGTMTVEAVYQDRDRFAQLVREVAAPDLGRMGMEILSFTIKDVVDSVDYLESLGKAQIAAVKKDAQVGVAEANRDAGIVEAQCEKEAADAKYAVDAKIANAKRELDIQQAEFDVMVATKKAEAELAYDVQKAKLMQSIREEEIKIDVTERHKNIVLEEKEVERREKELVATVKLPAEAEAYRMETIAEGEKTRVIEEAQANSEATKKTGEARAAVIEMVGKANAERMLARANAYKHYGTAATTALVLDKIPEVAENITKPLTRTREVLIMGGSDDAVSTLTNFAAKLPVTVKSVSGIDVTEAVRRAFGVGAEAV
ncbi:Flotillin-2 [Toxocara canis]|uniref:Phosphodiesterase n=1 Tax=Toxocara canis TaxID=6265 RepID=A0A0B2V4J8_TOXCA|nr:Flotillin-2 [Toxocara canis]